MRYAIRFQSPYHLSSVKRFVGGDMRQAAISVATTRSARYRVLGVNQWKLAGVLPHASAHAGVHVTGESRVVDGREARMFNLRLYGFLAGSSK